MDAPHSLLALQEIDLSVDQLRHRRATLPERARKAAVAAELTTIETEGASLSAQRDTLAARQAALEVDVAEVERRAADLDKQMRSGAVSAARDLQAMSDQVASLKHRRSDLEDAELEVMEAIDPLAASIDALQDRWAVLDTERTELDAAIAEAERTIDADLGAALAKRETAAGAVPADLLQTYERLRGRLGGIGAAAVVNGSCGGCHLALSATELDRIQKQAPDVIVTCEQCGRILVR